MKLLFVNLSALRFTAATPDAAPLGGSESALCYLARALAARGHEVVLAANLPGEAGLFRGIRHFSLDIIKDAGFFARENFAAIILCNAPAAAAPLKALASTSRILFWAHALPDQPSMQILARSEAKAAIDATIFVSEWQRSEVERVFGSFRAASVIGNGIAPAFEDMFASADEIRQAKQPRAAYTTTPFRGLSVLLRAMQGVDRDIQLDLFSSMQLYQTGDAEYADLFRQAAQNPNIIQHGALPQTALAQKLRRDAFLFYPCIYPETFCITAVEAMAAGMHIVTTRLGALEETTAGFADLVPVTTNGEALADNVRTAMQKAVDDFKADPQKWAQEKFRQAVYANAHFKWTRRAVAWEKILA